MRSGTIILTATIMFVVSYLIENYAAGAVIVYIG